MAKTRTPRADPQPTHSEDVCLIVGGRDESSRRLTDGQASGHVPETEEVDAEPSPEDTERSRKRINRALFAACGVVIAVVLAVETRLVIMARGSETLSGDRAVVFHTLHVAAICGPIFCLAECLEGESVRYHFTPFESSDPRLLTIILVLGSDPMLRCTPRGGAPAIGPSGDATSQLQTRLGGTRAPA